MTSEPSFTASSKAPLAGVLRLDTDVPTRVSVSVTDGDETWARDFYEFSTNHSLPLLGFKPRTTNEITVTVHDQLRNEVTASDPVVFVAPALPSDFSKIVLLTNAPEKMEPGYTLFRLMNRNNSKAYITIVDNAGQVVWYSGILTTAEIRQLENGDLFIPRTTGFVEADMLGNEVRTWPAPSGLTVDIHEGFLTDHGTILYLNDMSRVVNDFPTSSTDPNAPHQTTTVMCNNVVEISVTNAALLNTWSIIDMLEPTRIDYLTFLATTALGKDCEHANAIFHDTRDDSIIVSLRNQDAVIKFSRATGQLKWILGPHENWGVQWQQYLLTPVGTPFEWQYGQHAPTITPRGTLMLHDNGNYRASPFDTKVPDASNYSRAVEYDINEETMAVSQVWDFGGTNADRLYNDRVGSADCLPKTGNVLFTSGYVLYQNGARPNPAAPNATMIRLREVTHDDNPEVVFDLACFDYTTNNPAYLGTAGYRSHRIADLYGHLPQPVGDLTVSYETSMARLEFSGDPVRTYTVEASSDLAQWTELGEAVAEGGGEYEFDDTEVDTFSVRYYRVVTH